MSRGGIRIGAEYPKGDQHSGANGKEGGGIDASCLNFSYLKI